MRLGSWLALQQSPLVNERLKRSWAHQKAEQAQLAFRDEPEARAEFLALVRKGGL